MKDYGINDIHILGDLNEVLPPTFKVMYVLCGMLLSKRGFRTEAYTK
jgi:hypothetical protein